MSGLEQNPFSMPEPASSGPLHDDGGELPTSAEQTSNAEAHMHAANALMINGVLIILLALMMMGVVALLLL